MVCDCVPEAYDFAAMQEKVRQLTEAGSGGKVAAFRFQDTKQGQRSLGNARPLHIPTPTIPTRQNHREFCKLWA